MYLFASGVPAIGEIGVTDFLFGTKWKPSSGYYGIFPMIIGSILVTGIAVVIGVPIGILCAVFMSHYCPKKLYRFVKPAINLLAGIPSIVYGFFGLVVIVPIMKELFGGSGKSLLTAGILLGIMILPTVIKTTESSLNAVPKSYYEGALCEESIACAVKALFDEKTSEMITKVNDNEEETDHMEHDIEALCMKLLLHQQPVAKDLRCVSSALKMISDMERIGDQSQDIAEIAGFVHSTELAGKVHISDMANEAISMVTMSVDSFVRKDVKLAKAAIEADDKVDARFLEVKRELIELVRSDSGDAEYFMDLLLSLIHISEPTRH